MWEQLSDTGILQQYRLRLSQFYYIEVMYDTINKQCLTSLFAELPLTRVLKTFRSEDDVKLVSAEAAQRWALTQVASALNNTVKRLKDIIEGIMDTEAYTQILREAGEL